MAIVSFLNFMFTVWAWLCKKKYWNKNHADEATNPSQFIDYKGWCSSCYDNTGLSCNANAEEGSVEKKGILF